MAHEFGELSPKEQEIIRSHRAELEQQRQDEAFRLKALEVAARYEKWLQENALGDSLSTFLNQFDYQERDGKELHDAIAAIRKAATRTR